MTDYREMMENNESLKGKVRRNEDESSSSLQFRAYQLYSNPSRIRVRRRRCAADLLREEYLRKQKENK